MRRAALALVLFAAVTAPALAGAKPPVDPHRVYADAEGRLEAGLPLGGVAGLNAARFGFAADDCHRDLRIRLDYSPRNASADVGVAHVATPFELELVLSDAATGAPLPGARWTWRAPGVVAYRLDGPTDVAADVLLRRGVGVEWSARVSAWVDPAAECAWQGRLLVDEVEADPPGPDADAQWVELLNRGLAEADLSGWTLRSAATGAALALPAGTTLAEGARLVVPLPGLFLGAADEVALVAPRGWEVDRTPALADDADDARSWQREPSGAEEWAFRDATPGE